MHCANFGDFRKLVTFQILGFLRPFFAQNNLDVVLEAVFTPFLDFQFLTQTEHFAKAIANAFLPILVIFEKLSLFKY